ncbi:chemotaxis protein CheC [Thermincola potens]|uniref:CheC, inhibitor of MCP methylation n=1 Tax=Thermincola potens (strain JR) TaxID=635013 RepID=D5XFE7_THEPJ|nr:chemotaxis protein CheC [Thermincola potens]ADG82368.1 CheC, inhibitor of MCP methylation [Thermincola potens JR]
MSAFLELTESQLDALREIGTIGAGNGATALSVMMGKRIHMTVPEIKIIPFTEVTEALGGAEQVVAGLFTTTTGQAPCNILFVLPIESARVLVDILMGRPLGTTAELDALDKSALAEVANVVSGAYLNSLSSFTKLDFIPSVPAIAIDMAGAILDTVLAQAGTIGDHALLLETEFSAIKEKITGQFFLLPEQGSLEKILESIGVTG